MKIGQNTARCNRGDHIGKDLYLDPKERMFHGSHYSVYYTRFHNSVLFDICDLFYIKKHGTVLHSAKY